MIAMILSEEADTASKHMRRPRLSLQLLSYEIEATEIYKMVSAICNSVYEMVQIPHKMMT